jgi:hypothetical protein
MSSNMPMSERHRLMAQLYRTIADGLRDPDAQRSYRKLAEVQDQLSLAALRREWRDIANAARSKME